MNKNRTIGRYALCCGIIAISGGLAAQPAFAQQRAYEIRETSLSSALRQYMRVSGQQIVFSEEIVRGKRAPGVVGNYTADDALDRLLAGSGLRVKRSSAGVVMIVGMAAPGELQGNSAASMGDGAIKETDSDIVVTAQKRAERLIDTPQSISVVTGAQLERQGALQFRDFADTVPGLAFQTAGAGFTQISMRGVTVGFDVSPTVGVYVDEVPYGSSTGFARGGNLALDVGLFDTQRIEVLRGPQGTLYGASTMGGLIKYVTEKPDLTKTSGAVRAGASTTRYGGIGYSVSASFNTPLSTDMGGLRVGAYFSHDGGYVDNVSRRAKDVDRSDTYGGRADLLLQPTDRLKVRIAGFVQNIDRDGFPIADFALNGTPLNGSLRQNHRYEEPFRQRFRLVSGTAEYNLGSAALTSVTSYQYTLTRFNFDRTPNFGGLCPLVGVACSAAAVSDRSITKKFTQELRLASNGTHVLDWLIGGFYTRETSSARQQIVLRNLAGAPITADLATFFIPSTYKEVAAFADLTWHITTALDVTGGVRYAKNDQTFQQFGTGLIGTSFPRTPSSADVVTYLANARYRFSDRGLVYFRYATGYRPGGPNYQLRDPSTGNLIGARVFDSDSLQSYEGGVKFETDDQSFSFDLSAYHIDWKNIIIAVNIGGFGGRANAPGGATIDGGELTAVARPSRDFSITGTFAYQKARLAAAEPRLSSPKGASLPGVPRYTATVSGDYVAQSSALKPSLGATLRFVDRRPANFSSGRRYVLPSYATIDLRGGVSLGNFDLRLYLRNLLDVRGQVTAPISSPIAGPILVSMLQPRTIGFNISTRF